MPDPVHYRQAADALRSPLRRLGAPVLPRDTDAGDDVWQGAAAERFRQELRAQRRAVAVAVADLDRLRNDLARTADDLEAEQRRQAEAEAAAAG